jgi:TP901 family phage tail tape measure protein
MSDTLKLAMRISAVDLFSGVLRRFRNEVAGTGAAAKSVQRDYDNMIRHSQAGLKSLAVGSFLYDKLKPAVEQASLFQDSMLKTEGLLQNQYKGATQLRSVMGELADNARDVAKHMMYNAVAVSDVQRQLVQAGVPKDAILERRNASGKVIGHGAAYQIEAFAEVNDLDPATTARNVANVAHAFQLVPDQYGGMVDILQKAMNLGSGDATEFFHNMQNFGAIAHLGNTSPKDAAIALKVISPLGESGGSDLAQAMSYAFGGSMRGSKQLEKYGLNFYDKAGKFIGLFPMLDKLSAYISSHHMTEEERNKMLARGFQQSGLKAISLEIEADKPGAKSRHEMARDFDKQASLAQLVATREKGFKMSWQEMVTTIQTTEATIFNPLLPQLTAVAKLTNKWAGDLGKVASNHPAFAKAVSYGSEAAIGVAGAYGLYRLGQTGFSLKSFLKGKAGLAGGIVEGEAVKAATGIAPVFVTNFPAGFGAGVAGAAGAAEEAAEGAGTVGIVKRLTTRLGIAGTAFAELGGGGATGAAIASGGVAIAGGAGYLTGHELSKHVIEGTRYGDAIGERIAHVLAFFGDKESQQAIAQMNKAQPALQKLEGTIHIQISQDGRARVTSVQSSNPKVPLDVGTMLMLP